MAKNNKLELKKLFDESYVNANKDRSLAISLLREMESWLRKATDPDSQATLGSVCARLLEKSSNSNRQIIKIAEILQNTENVKVATASGSEISQEEKDVLLKKLEKMDFEDDE